MKQVKRIDLPGEIWLPVKGYEGFYEVSNFGRVVSLGRWVPNNLSKSGFAWRKERMMKLGHDKDGYLRVGLRKNGEICKTKKVHRLVAEAFIPNPLNLPEVNHKDENKENNRVDNLEHCDTKYNINYGTRNERSAQKRRKKVNQYDSQRNFIKTHNSIREASKETGIPEKNITSCLTNPKRKTAGGFIWEYAA